MKDIYSDEEIEIIAKHLNFVSGARLGGYLANFSDLEELDTEDMSNEEISAKFESVFIEELRKLKQKLNIESDLSSKSLDEKILIVIKLTKELNKNYLLRKFDGKIDDEIAERLVEYGYTHGSCNSLLNTLCKMFDECKSKIFKTKSYSHQCVMYNERYFDITGASSIDEMKSFVAKEGKSNVDECVVCDVELKAFRHKALDYMLCKYITRIFDLGIEREKI